jgi:hypothetical protein
LRKKKPPCGGFYSPGKRRQRKTYLAAEASEAGAIAAAGAEASAAGATTTGAGAGATTTGAGASSFLPHATKAAAAITAAKTSDLFILKLPSEFVGKKLNQLTMLPGTPFKEEKTRALLA